MTPVNANKPQLWKADIARSVDLYNAWFLKFAPQAFRESRTAATAYVETALSETTDLTTVTAAVLRQHPGILPILRMTTCPPLARDRLIGLSGVPAVVVNAMEHHQRIPPRMAAATADGALQRIADVLLQLRDHDIFPWLGRKQRPSKEERYRAATIVADRVTGANANPIIRNAQETRQLEVLAAWLDARGYKHLDERRGVSALELPPGTYTFRFNIPVEAGESTVNIPVDAAIKPLRAKKNTFPLLLEAKSAGDFTNTNKRRKEEATKMAQLRATYGDGVQYILLLCGYFDAGYLGYEAHEGIDWVWEHRLDDLAAFGL